jgi:hypothetical protein
MLHALCAAARGTVIVEQGSAEFVRVLGQRFGDDGDVFFLHISFPFFFSFVLETPESHKPTPPQSTRVHHPRGVCVFEDRVAEISAQEASKGTPEEFVSPELSGAEKKKKKKSTVHQKNAAQTILTHVHSPPLPHPAVSPWSPPRLPRATRLRLRMPWTTCGAKPRRASWSLPACGRARRPWSASSPPRGAQHRRSRCSSSGATATPAAL